MPAELSTKSLKLIAVNQPEKRFACLLVEREPRAGVSPVADDLDGAHGAQGLPDCPTTLSTIGPDLIAINISKRLSTGYPQFSR